MWILPKPLHTLPSASDTEALISDLKEQSEMCAQSLFRKSSPSPSRTWLASWKRDSWSQLLCGRILKPSLGKNFTERWTSFQAAFPVNLFQVQAAEQAMKTQGISSPTSSTVSSDLDSQDLFSLKTWKESLVPNSREKDGETLREPRFCSMSSESWKGWVTTQRQQWSQRQSAALRTGASVSSSLESVTTWPTAQTSDANGAASPDRDAHRKQLRDVETGMGAWPTPTTAEADKISNQANYGQQGLSNHPAIVGERTREKGKKSRSGEAMWPTMTAQEAHNTLGGSNYNRVTIPLGTMALMHGQADPDSANTSGNHQGLSEEQSQRNWQTFAPGTHDRGAIPHRQVVKGLVTGEKAKTQCLTVDQVFAEEIKGTNPSWATPNTMDTLPPRSPEAMQSQGASGSGDHGGIQNMEHSKGIVQRREHRDFQGEDGETSGVVQHAAASTSAGVPNTTDNGLQEHSECSEQRGQGGEWTSDSWGVYPRESEGSSSQVDGKIKSKVGRGPNGSSNRMGQPSLYESNCDRASELRMLGNGVVPQSCERAFRILIDRICS